MTQTQVQEYFPTKDASYGILSKVTIEQVSYSYSFAVREKAPNLADVSLGFTIVVEGQEYPVHTYGTVDAYPLSSGDILWEGALDGVVIIDDMECSVIAGFSKLGSNAIQVSVTIQPGDMDDITLPIMFTFGEDVISADIHQELVGRSEQMQRADCTDSNFFWIVGIESFDFNEDDFNAGAVFIDLLFQDAMSLMGVPTATISSVLNGLKGSVTEVCYTGPAITTRMRRIRICSQH